MKSQTTKTNYSLELDPDHVSVRREPSMHQVNELEYRMDWTKLSHIDPKHLKSYPESIIFCQVLAQMTSRCTTFGNKR